MSFIEKNITEIKNSKVLVYFGAVLLLLNILFFSSYWNWVQIFREQEIQYGCWSFFPNCLEVHQALPEWFFKLYVLIVVLLVLVGVVSFILRRIFVACLCLFVVSLLKIGFIAQTSYLIGNINLITFLVSFSFLFIPQKINTIRWFLILVYFISGLLKLNHDWLSLSSLGPIPFIPDWLSLILIRVLIVFEVFIVFLLIYGKKIERKIVFFFLIVFHLMSLYWIDYLFPLSMIGLLSIFLFVWIFPPEQKKHVQLSLSGKLLIFGYLFFHFARWLLPGDYALTNVSSPLTLNHYDSRTICATWSVIQFDNEWIELDFSPHRRHQKIYCDPLQYKMQAERACAELIESYKNFKDFHFFWTGRRYSDPFYSISLSADHFCSFKKSKLEFLKGT